MMNAGAERERGRPVVYDRRRLEVLRAAARVFSEQGFRQATLEDVAGELGITRPALYHYARSKDELLSECDKLAREQLDEAMTNALHQPVGLAQLQSFFREYAAITADEFGRCFIVTAQSEMSLELRESVKVYQRGLARAVVRFVELGIKDGSIQACNAVDVSRAMFGAFNGAARAQRVSSRPAHQLADSFLAIFVDGLRPGR